MVPPDEYAGVVDNSVYTNQVAREALQLAGMFSVKRKECGECMWI